MSHCRSLFMHPLLQRLQSHFFMLFLSVFHLLQNIAHVKLHTPNEGHLKYKGTHEVIENIAALLLQINSLVLVQSLQNVVVSHGKAHHSINFCL